jgi:adenosine deaminase
VTLTEAIEKLPKTDLHCHVDGSLRPETILDIAKKEKVDLGVSSLQELKQILVCGRRVSTLQEFLRAFKMTTPVMQTEEALERIAYELAEDAYKENVRYFEVRFTPIWCTEKGLTHEQVFLATEKGLARARKQYGIRTGIIVCAIRIFDPKISVELAHLAVSLKNKGVVGFDLAHAEKGNPPGKHAEAYRIAAKGGLGLTVHAGEDCGPESIREALDECGAMRIGHGLTLSQDPALEARIREENIPLECCPSSNVQINLVRDYADHPVRGYLQRGVRATLNTDNRLLTGINVTDEYLRCQKHLGMTWDELKTVALNGFHAAFLPEKEKAKLLGEMTADIASLEPSRQ